MIDSWNITALTALEDSGEIVPLAEYNMHQHTAKEAKYRCQNDTFIHHMQLLPTHAYSRVGMLLTQGTTAG